MDLLDRTGDRADALELYREYAARLERELDAQPSPETQAHIETIRRRRDVIASTTVPTATTNGATSAGARGEARGAARGEAPVVPQDVTNGREPTLTGAAQAPAASREIGQVAPSAPRPRRIASQPLR